MSELTVLGLVFGVTTLTATALGLLTFGWGERDLSEESPGRLYGPLTRLVAGLLPPSDAGRAEHRRLLLTAGYYHHHALDNFFALRASLAVFPVIAAELLAFVAEPPLSFVLMVGGLVVGALGFSLPKIVLGRQAAARADEFSRSMPALLDVLALPLSAGASLADALRDAAAALRRGYPAVSAELRLIARQAELRSMGQALAAWKERVAIPEVGTLTFLLIQSEKLGTDVSSGLNELSDSYRVAARQRAESRATMTNFWLLFPTMGCLFLSGAVIMLGPYFLELNRETDRLRETLVEYQKQANELLSAQPDAVTEVIGGKRKPPAAAPPPAGRAGR